MDLAAIRLKKKIEARIKGTSVAASTSGRPWWTGTLHVRSPKRFATYEVSLVPRSWPLNVRNDSLTVHFVEAQAVSAFWYVVSPQRHSPSEELHAVTLDARTCS
jgi:hypothetical protein